ncbi:hypothetical protein GCM10009834_09100 [Streptomonospora arabica]
MDERRPAEHLQMLGDGRAAHIELLGEVAGRPRPVRQKLQQTAARGVGQGEEDVI